VAQHTWHRRLEMLHIEMPANSPDRQEVKYVEAINFEFVSTKYSQFTSLLPDEPH
jgi:hypothetical protein